jgi:hypothetical protein
LFFLVVLFWKILFLGILLILLIELSDKDKVKSFFSNSLVYLSLIIFKSNLSNNSKKIDIRIKFLLLKIYYYQDLYHN